MAIVLPGIKGGTNMEMPVSYRIRPKYRRKVIYGQLKVDNGYILRKLSEEKKVGSIEAEAYADHIHMLVSIPLHLSVAQFMVYRKEKTH